MSDKTADREPGDKDEPAPDAEARKRDAAKLRDLTPRRSEAIIGGMSDLVRRAADSTSTKKTDS